MPLAKSFLDEVNALEDKEDINGLALLHHSSKAIVYKRYIEDSIAWIIDKPVEEVREMIKERYPI